METLASSRLVISGTSATSGASMLGVGLAAELKRRGLSLSVCVIGPNLPGAVIYRRLIGRPVRCLDDRLMSPGQNLVTAYQSTIGADVVLIEGASGGLYDGVSLNSFRGSTAEMAGLIHTPVALVASVSGLGNSIGALVKGYADAARDFPVVGAIINGVGATEGDASRERERFDSIMQLFGTSPVLGVVPEYKSNVILPGGDFDQSANRTSLPRQFLVDMSTIVSRNVDVDALLAHATRATQIKISDYEHRPYNRRARIAVSDDTCFNLAFQDNVDLLRFYGAEIVPFSPLADSGIPRKVGAVYLTGAYLSDYGSELASNKSFKDSLRDFAADGGVVYSEGGGTAYLCNGFRVPSGESFEGVGMIPAQAVSQASKFNYLDMVTVDESVFGRAGLMLKGVSTGEWRITGEGNMIKALRLSTLGTPSYPEGYSPGAQVLATFGFMHMGSNPEIAKNLVDAAEVVQKI